MSPSAEAAAFMAMARAEDARAKDRNEGLLKAASPPASSPAAPSPAAPLSAAPSPAALSPFAQPDPPPAPKDTSVTVPEPIASTVYAEETELSPEDLEMEAMMQAALQRAEAAFSQDNERMRSLAKQASSRSLQSLGGSQKYLSEALAAVAGDDDVENSDNGDNFEEDDEDSSPPSEGDESSPAQASALRVATRAPPDGDSEGENMPGEELRQASAPRL